DGAKSRRSSPPKSVGSGPSGMREARQRATDLPTLAGSTKAIRAADMAICGWGMPAIGGIWPQSRELAWPSTAVLALLCACLWQGDRARAEEADVILVPHRAVYDFSLSKSQAHSGVLAVFGRMVYELTGSTCEGYTEKLRFVTEMTNAEGEPTIADLQSSSWEEASGKRFRFNSTDLRDGKPAEDIAGDATRVSMLGHLIVELTKPDPKQLTLP